MGINTEEVTNTYINLYVIDYIPETNTYVPLQKTKAEVIAQEIKIGSKISTFKTRKGAQLQCNIINKYNKNKREELLGTAVEMHEKRKTVLLLPE